MLIETFHAAFSFTLSIFVYYHAFMKQTLFKILIFSLLFSSCKKKEDVQVADELKYKTDFSEDDHTWYSDASHQLFPVDGYYRMSQSQENYQSWGIAPYSTINYNYSISADVKLYVTYPHYGGIGLLFNYIDNNHYCVYYIRNDGTVYVFRKQGSSFITLVKPTYSAAIKIGSGQTNHVEVRQSGSSATLYVNGTGIGSCEAPRGNGLISAGVALTTSASPYFTPLTGDFDNVSIKKIQ
ncbi:MAG: hypothetical protein JWM14_901 [Chitinophagaceae bacterium]|nr:hypothetical protein [Chitinophagaceae bacterium]